VNAWRQGHGGAARRWGGTGYRVRDRLGTGGEREWSRAVLNAASVRESGLPAPAERRRPGQCSLQVHHLDRPRRLPLAVAVSAPTRTAARLCSRSCKVSGGSPGRRPASGGLKVQLLNARTYTSCRAARLTSPTPDGRPGWSSTAWCGRVSCPADDPPGSGSDQLSVAADRRTEPGEAAGGEGPGGLRIKLSVFVSDLFGVSERAMLAR
jgi:hypothetical protein